MDNGKKNSPKVLTTNDIRKHARDWTLAGDVGLLAHLEQFSENVINRTQETQNNFNELVDHYEELYTKVGNITNQFLALQNCQFVENRVYDEETPTEEKPEVKVKDEAEKEKLLLMQYKEAVEVGVKLLDTHFQEVQLPPNSDSDEEDEYSAGNSVIWKPKNPYASKKFPLLIGSAEWWADDRVGLGTNEDGLDSEKVISESESELESLKSVEKTMKSSSSSSMENIKSIPKKTTYLESSSEDLFGFDKNETQQNASETTSKGSSSLVEDSANIPSDLGKEENKKTDAQEQPNQTEATGDKPKKVDNAFTRELMAKLVSVTNKKERLGEEKPPEEPTGVKVEGDLFDETDDTSDLFSSNANVIQEKASGEKGLFGGDDDEFVKNEEDLFSEGDLFKTAESQPFDRREFEPPKNSEKEVAVTAKKNLVNDLFDDLDDEDTLFAAKRVTHKPSLETDEDIFSSSKPSTVSKQGWENEEGLFDGIDTEMDDDFFNPSGLFDVNINKATESPATSYSKTKDADLFSKEPQLEKKLTVENSPKKSIFDDPFGFTSKEPTETKSRDTDDEGDLFSKGPKEEKKPFIKVLPLAEDDDDDALFGEKPKPPDSISISSSRSSLFDDVSGSKSRLASVFEKDKTTKPEDDLFSDPLFAGDGGIIEKDVFSAKGSEKGKSSSLFDDWDDGDDLFGASKKGKPVEEEKIDLFKTTKLRETKSEVIKRSLFADDLDDAELFSDEKAQEKRKPPSSLSLKEKESGKVGKLNIPDNLKVKFESAAKHISPGGGTKPEEKKEVLDEPMQSSNLLKCPSRDRVKIPGRRRPQSRRARQEAIRNSGLWEDSISPTQTKDSLPSPAASNPLSPSTDEEDFFKVPELDTNFEREDQSIFKSDLFESAKTSKHDDNLLFDGAPVLSPLSPEKTQPSHKTNQHGDSRSFVSKTKASIFDDENLEGDDENLFNVSKPPPDDTALFRTNEKIDKMKKPLFDTDLDDDEDDLFGGKRHASPKPAKVDKRKEGGGEKEKANLSFVDPLGLMTNDD